MRLRAVYTPTWECLECGRRHEFFPDVANGEICCGHTGTRNPHFHEEQS